MAVAGCRDHVTVGIVGGGIGGLALARMLEMSGISYRLFEAHELVPDAGASIGLMPSGLRILDQLGVIDKIEEWSVAHDHWEHRDGRTGEIFASSDAMSNYPDVFGYGAFFMERRHILGILYDSIEDQSKLEGLKKVTMIENFDDCAIVKSADGSCISCQIVAGTDGVHSAVRKFIRHELAVPTPPKNYLTADTYCVFGISSPVAQIGEGRHFSIYQHDASVLVFSGISGKLYWFIFKSLEKSLKYGERKMFTETDIEAAYSLVSTALITEGVQFSDIYANLEYQITLPVEEGICESWHAKRMFLMGDATHKMAPHAAMGANLAIESAACFVNNLRGMQGKAEYNTGHTLPQSQLWQCFETYANQRKDRVTALTELARSTKNIQLKIGPASEKFIRALSEMKEFEWLRRGLVSLCQAEKLEDWRWNSERVDLYTARAHDFMKVVAEGKEIEYTENLMAILRGK